MTSKISKKVSCSKLGEIRAFTVLSLSKRKLNSLDDEEELFRSVLITNTMKSVKQEMSTVGKKGSKKSKDKMVRRVKNRITSFGTQSHRRLNIWKRNVSNALKGKKGMKKYKSMENLLA